MIDFLSRCPRLSINSTIFANKQLSIFTPGLDKGQNGFCCNRPFQSNQLSFHRVLGSTKLCYFALIPYFQLYIGSYCTFSRLKCQLVERINHGALSFLFPLIYCFSFIANISLCQKRTIQFPSKFRLFIIQYYSLVDFFTTQIPSFYFIRRVFLAKEIRRAGVLWFLMLSAHFSSHSKFCRKFFWKFLSVRLSPKKLRIKKVPLNGHEGDNLQSVLTLANGANGLSNEPRPAVN